MCSCWLSPSLSHRVLCDIYANCYKLFMVPITIPILFLLVLIYNHLQATSGLGAAASYALAKEGYYVVLGRIFHVCFLKIWNAVLILFVLVKRPKCAWWSTYHENYTANLQMYWYEFKEMLKVKMYVKGAMKYLLIPTFLLSLVAYVESANGECQTLFPSLTILWCWCAFYQILLIMSSDLCYKEALIDVIEFIFTCFPNSW